MITAVWLLCTEHCILPTAFVTIREGSRCFVVGLVAKGQSYRATWSRSHAVISYSTGIQDYTQFSVPSSWGCGSVSQNLPIMHEALGSTLRQGVQCRRYTFTCELLINIGNKLYLYCYSQMLTLLHNRHMIASCIMSKWMSVSETADKRA